MRIDLEDDKTIELVEGDITREMVDAIVNAANSSLMGGGGVDGAIHRSGGPAILEECKRHRARIGRLLPGHAVHTTAGRLPARYVIHTVGPIYDSGQDGEPETLANCYRESLRLADRLLLRSIAFPSISTGAFGYPVRLAAAVALNVVRETLASCDSVDTVRFVLFGFSDFRVYRDAAERLLAVS
jgi:O-acetyl-ADP-ribose deacetylase (regulator of RNase III)